jgi:hypothetical protein
MNATTDDNAAFPNGFESLRNEITHRREDNRSV